MTMISSDAQCCFSQLYEQYFGSELKIEKIIPLCVGASGRNICRIEGMIGIYWTAIRADNNSFLCAASALTRHGISVPKILAFQEYPQGTGVCFVEDLGNADILSFRDASWNIRKDAYRMAFETLIPFYKIQPDWVLQPSFDADLYRWEQDYFAEHYLKRHLKWTQEKQEKRFPLALRVEIIDFLSSLPQMPIHRDCQSQNIMISDSKAYLIDFQGMRMGRYEYDLASLIYDPYMNLSHDERMELLALWEKLYTQPLDWDIFTACAMQRLMQAMGSFANIGYNQHNSWYLDLFAVAEESLHQIKGLVPKNSPAYKFSLCL